ncbi:hypothetical protein M404DRAFT_992459 [Pisolithus tinctorius Marx 270]|uniref:Uncharacterized protein n=1 Tax=Pisolithus tinctorius Marx 270 TaxID=870435 RepID=A0A0C3PJ79_PISTI|nr:hypothetical protein M404DRAFT_992459 [Pisolithus tinctorius Marx 270]
MPSVIVRVQRRWSPSGRLHNESKLPEDKREQSTTAPVLCRVASQSIGISGFRHCTQNTNTALERFLCGPRSKRILRAYWIHAKKTEHVEGLEASLATQHAPSHQVISLRVRV